MRAAYAGIRCSSVTTSATTRTRPARSTAQRGDDHVEASDHSGAFEQHLRATRDHRSG